MLFRGKRVDHGEWVYGYYIKPTHHCHDKGKHNDWIVTMTIQNGGWCNVAGKHAVVPETVGQFTGLTDRNGKRIFEGDIVARYDDYKDDIMTEEYARIKYGVHNCGCCHSVYGFAPCSNIGVPNGSFSLSGSYNDDKECEELVVVGNIHDNPELMKG